MWLGVSSKTTHHRRAGVVAAARTQGNRAQHGKPLAWSGTANRSPVRDRPGALGWRRGPLYRRSRVMPVEGRGRSSRQTQDAARDRGLGSLSTPESVQKLQQALHAKAKAEAGYRFYALYDKTSARIFWRMRTLCAAPIGARRAWTARISAMDLTLVRHKNVPKKNTATTCRRTYPSLVSAQQTASPDETLQNFMLANELQHRRRRDSDLAHRSEIADLETRYGIELARVGRRQHHGTHRFLKVRNDAVHIPDYKPNARTNKPIAQLATMRSCLRCACRAWRLFDIKCAWFNEEEYNEFFP